MRNAFHFCATNAPVATCSCNDHNRAARGGIVLAILFISTLVGAQAPPAGSQDAHHKANSAAAPIAEQSPPAAPVPPAARTPEQLPPRPPQVLWDGKYLSINCENSRLSDILAAVRTRIGASIEIPLGAAAERIVTSLGPAPAREVLAALLSSTDFDYVIQASDNSDDLIASVLLTPRGRTDDKDGQDPHPVAGVRRMPGYTDSGRRTFEVSRETMSENSAPPAETAAYPDPGQPVPEPSTGLAEKVSDAVPSSPVETNTQAAIPDQRPPDGGSGVENSTPSAIPAIVPFTVGSGAASPSSSSQMLQDLQRMYQQRRQLQTQQNQQLPPPQPN